MTITFKNGSWQTKDRETYHRSWTNHADEISWLAFGAMDQSDQERLIAIIKELKTIIDRVTDRKFPVSTKPNT